MQAVRIRHIYREANVCVDLLANRGCDQQLSLVVYEQAPSFSGQALQQDIMGVHIPRFVTV